MAHVEDLHKRKDGSKKPAYGRGMRWRVVWDDGGKRRTRSFRNKTAADQFKTSVDHRQHSGEYIPTSNQRAFIADLLPVWEASLIRLKASTRGEVAIAVRSAITPHWGHRQVGSVTRQEVQAWISTMHTGGKSARTVETLYGRMRTFYSWAVTEGYVPVSPCQNIVLPRGGSREHIYLTPKQVRALIDAMPEQHRLLAEFLVTTGVRFGEAAELRGKDLDLPRRRANINRAVTRGTVDTPKTHRRRSVPLTESVSAQLGERDIGREDLVFTSARGGQLQVNNFKSRVFDQAVARAGLPEGLRVHDCRHTAASLAVASGANVKAVQRMLGHASAALTLDTYSGLFSEDLDDVAARMSKLLDL